MAVETYNRDLQLLLNFSNGDPGDRFWYYDVLGEGSFGKVVKGEDSELRRQRVAIKIIREEVLMTDTSLILNEVRNQRVCWHPNIVMHYGVFDFPGELWMVLEYVNGMDAEQLVSNTNLQPPTIAFIVKKVLLALNYLHTKEILHRDIKPANLLISYDGQVKVADFGLSIKASEKKALGAGTASFLAPDTLRSPNYSFPVDIWALGISIYVFAERKYPYDHICKTKNQKYAIIENNRHTPRLSHHQPQHMRDFVSHCLQEENRRPAANQLLAHPWLCSSCTENEMACLMQKIRTGDQSPDDTDNYINYYSGITLPNALHK